MIETAVIISLFTTGLRVVSDKGMILNFYKKLIYKIVKTKFIRKPLIDCPPCMSSIYGMPIYFWLNPELSIENSVNLIICLISAASISYFITQFWDE